MALAMWARAAAALPCGQGWRLRHVGRGGGLAMWAGAAALPCGQTTPWAGAKNTKLSMWEKACGQKTKNHVYFQF